MKSKDMEGKLIMGLDPGYGRMGFGVIYVQGSKMQLVDYGVATTLAGDAFENRLLHLGNDLHDLFVHHQPDVVAIEKLFFGKNTTTAMNVAHARGVALLMTAQAGCPLVEYTPAQIKKAVTGDGKAGKMAMQRMVKELLDLAKIPKPDDAADALAVAITASTKRW